MLTLLGTYSMSIRQLWEICHSINRFNMSMIFGFFPRWFRNALTTTMLSTWMLKQVCNFVKISFFLYYYSPYRARSRRHIYIFHAIFQAHRFQHTYIIICSFIRTQLTAITSMSIAIIHAEAVSAGIFNYNYIFSDYYTRLPVINSSSGLQIE